MSLLSPPASLLVKLGSLVVHYQEMLSPSGHEFDKAAIGTLETDPEVVGWLKGMTDIAMLPKKRNDRS